MNLQQEMEYYMKLPYTYNIEEIKTAHGGTHYIGYISELGIKASGKTKKDVTTNLTLVKRDYILNKLTNHKNIPQGLMRRGIITIVQKLKNVLKRKKH